MTSHAAMIATLSTITGVRRAGLSCGITGDADLSKPINGEASPAPMIQMLIRPSAAIVTDAWMPFNLPLLNPRPTRAAARQIGNRDSVSVSRREAETPYVIICSARITSTSPIAFIVNVLLSKRRIIPASANQNGLEPAQDALSPWQKSATPIRLPDRAAPAAYRAFRAELHDRAH